MLVASGLALLATASDAQQPFGRRGRSRFEVQLAKPESFTGGFNFCRVMFRSNRYGDGGGWGVDWPTADQNFPIRLSELTKADISYTPAGDPNSLIVRFTDPELFQCPFIMMTEVGSAFLDEEEAARLREYLLKGGFLWADDFWGSYAWSSWANQLSKVLPANEYPIGDLTPDHPLFRTLFEVERVPQVPSYNFWVGSGGRTSERGADSAQPHARVISDQNGRIVVLMTHNTDLGDSWEREAESPDYFYNFSVDGYAFGINAVLYAMTH